MLRIVRSQLREIKPASILRQVAQAPPSAGQIFARGDDLRPLQLVWRPSMMRSGRPIARSSTPCRRSSGVCSRPESTSCCWIIPGSPPGEMDLAVLARVAAQQAGRAIGRRQLQSLPATREKRSSSSRSPIIWARSGCCAVIAGNRPPRICRRRSPDCPRDWSTISTWHCGYAANRSNGRMPSEHELHAMPRNQPGRYLQVHLGFTPGMALIDYSNRLLLPAIRTNRSP